MMRKAWGVVAVVGLVGGLAGCAGGSSTEALCAEAQAALNTMQLGGTATSVEALDPFIEKYRQHADVLRELEGGEAVAEGLEGVADALDDRDEAAGRVASSELTIALGDLTGVCQFE